MKKIIIATILIGVLAMLGACSRQEAKVEADIIDLGAQPSAQTVEAYGLMKATEVKDITIDFPASIEQIHVKNGQRVTKNDVLITLNTKDLQAQIKEMECELNSYKAEKDLLKAEGDLSKAKEDLSKAQKENISEAEKSLSIAGEDLSKAQKENISKAEKDLSKSGDSLSKAQKEKLEVMEENLTVMEENLALMKGKLNKEYLKEDQIISDIEKGLVYNIEYVKGDMVNSGSRVISIADLESIIVSANIDEQFISYVELGAKVEIIPEYNKNTVIHGTVSFISSKAFQNNGETTVPVEIVIDQTAEQLILDADVQVKIFPVED